MKDNKIIPIDKFIEYTLYNPKNGYYSTKNPFGKSGDFITAPGISFLFSEMIAIWIISFWENLNKPKNFNIIELGPGNGDLCKILLKTFKKFPDFNKSVNILMYEKSDLLKKIQKKKIKENNVKWLKKINQIRSGPTLFFGNEFFDAIPIKQFENKKGQIFERCLKINKSSSMKTTLRKASNKICKKLRKFNLINKNSIIEYPELGFKELEIIIKIIKKFGGGLLLIDYGFLKQKGKNTLQSVKSHKKNKVFSNLGSADITSLVNFSLLEQYFKANNLMINKIVSQSFFLKRLGIVKRAEILGENMSFKEKSDLYLRLKRLLHPKQMGELFKVVFTYKLRKKFSLGFK